MERKEGTQIRLTQKPFVGVFDSGLGGISVLAELIRTMPHMDFEYFGDSLHAPYGTKTTEFVRSRAEEICGNFIYRGASAVVIACNTATSVAAKELRGKYTVPIVGMEPAVKPAIEYLSKTGISGKIAVLATPMTLKERKYKELVHDLHAEECVAEIPSPELVELVEHHFFNDAKIKKTVEAFVRTKINPLGEIAAIVLGCTHFVFLKRHFESECEGIPIIDGNAGTARRLASLLGEIEPSDGVVRILNSAGEEKTELSKKLLKYRLDSEEYAFVESMVHECIENLLNGREKEFAKLYYADKKPLQEIMIEMNLKEKELKKVSEEVRSKVFKHMKRADRHSELRKERNP